MKKIIAMLIAMLLMGSCALAETQMYVLSVGKADAILLKDGDAAVLIDAGYARSRGKILAGMRELGVTELAAVFLTHTDSDHADGLEWLAESDIPVGTWYASKYFIGVKEKKHPAVQAANARGQEVVWLEAGDSVVFGGAVLNVLAPGALNETKDNDNSLVMMLESADGKILLAGDMELYEEELLLNEGVDLSCDVLKVANHADGDTTGETFARATSPKLAVVSTDSYEKPSTPDAAVLSRLKAVGAEIAVTQDATGGLLVTLNDGTINLEKIDLPAANADIYIESVIPGDDLIVIANHGSETVALDDWYLISSRGGEWFVIPNGTFLTPGERITIGTNSSPDEEDLLWDDKKVIHKSKADVITLYDSNGMAVSSMSNGF